MSREYSRLTLIAQRGRNELVVTLHRRSQQLTVLWNRQLVCSRSAANNDLTVYAAPDAFNPSSLREAVKQLRTAICHSGLVSVDEARPACDQQQPRLGTSPKARLVSHHCARCGSSMIYETAEQELVPLCPACQLTEVRATSLSVALAIEIIHGQLARQLKNSRADLSRPAANTIEKCLCNLRDLGEQLNALRATRGDLGSDG